MAAEQDPTTSCARVTHHLLENRIAFKLEVLDTHNTDGRLRLGSLCEEAEGTVASYTVKDEPRS